MNLLFKRDQSLTKTGRVQFSLWAKTEFDADERALIQRYRFGDAKLIDVDQPGLWRQTLLCGAGVAGVGLVLAFTILAQFPFSWLLALLAGGLAAYLYYDSSRETVRVGDLIHGRYFDCGSVVDLAKKEAWLAEVAAVLRDVMETAKQWGGTDTIPIEPAGKIAPSYIALKAL